jgi:hypothetical protein
MRGRFRMPRNRRAITATSVVAVCALVLGMLSVLNIQPLRRSPSGPSVAIPPTLVGVTKPVASVKALAVAKDGEIPALRTATSDTYQVKDAADGQTHYLSDFFAAPVNWQDATGAWQPIDTGLVAVSGGSGSMRTTSGATVRRCPPIWRARR